MASGYSKDLQVGRQGCWLWLKRGEGGGRGMYVSMCAAAKQGSGKAASGLHVRLKLHKGPCGVRRAAVLG